MPELKQDEQQLNNQEQNPTPELENKIKQVELEDSINKEYYSDTRIRG